MSKEDWYSRGDVMTPHTFKIPKTYNITKESLTLEDVSLIIRALEIGIADNHPLFEQAVKQGLINVSV